MLAKKLIDNGDLYVENGIPLLFFEVSDNARRATLRDMYLLKPVWTSLMSRLIGGRK
jgi:hypothetical protein